MSTTHDRLQLQIDDLQARLLYQEDTLQVLNDVIVRQDAAIVQLQQQLQNSQAKWASLADRLDALPDEKPPHY